VPISTSNLATPPKEAVLRHLERGLGGADREQALFAELAARLCDYHRSPHCVLFSTGFWALVAAIRLRALPGRTQVIIPSFTYRRLADVVYWAGLIPVFVDVADDLAVSPAAIAENIGNETALILAVHPIVNCCDVTAILALAQSSGIPVVFDAVESAHETYKGRRIGSFGVGEVFSLHASKLVNGLEGGYVCTDDTNFAGALETYKTGARVAIHSGLNGLPNIGHAAFALASLEDLPATIAHNRQVYECYRQCLRGRAGISLLRFDETEQTSFKNIVVEVRDDFPVSRDVLVNAMNTESILARKHYQPPLHKKRFSYPVVIRDMTRTEAAERRFLNLPCGSRVSEPDVRLVCDFIGFVADHSELFVETPS
jgi:dTDP-4-amino-4,6-dideoxygalactose transaminase